MLSQMQLTAQIHSKPEFTCARDMHATQITRGGCDARVARSVSLTMPVTKFSGSNNILC